MAKRKRLMPAQGTYLSEPLETKSALGGPAGHASAPIAKVASESSVHAALQELSDTLETARTKGLMIAEVPLGAIDETYLVRDRMAQDEDEMAALVDSIRARGQQTPIEVLALEDGRYGLISGCRRLTALRRLYAETDDPRFATVRALVVRADTAESAYVAMVEENEIRVNLSHYERARIVTKALAEGVFPTLKSSLQTLFANVPRAKRSKIGSFVTLVNALDDDLHYPTAISEKLGLALVKAMSEDTGFEGRLKAALQDHPRETAAEEIEILQQAVQTEVPEAAPPVKPAPTQPAEAAPRTPATVVQVLPGVRLGFSADRNRIELSGQNVDADLVDALEKWLKTR
ncbi:ParB/RepB/Spo0J family partition protein [Donghicola sp. XS_ASV15]|uniref:ParB/RepB/Spo0J family partition protein n=1 Tax=Donghicola sp. XS_ASV15 TaxID=3241295 RepID=UPI0035122F8D